MIPLTLWTLIALFLGSIPFSPILARAFTGIDIRAVGDGNPGATNAWKAGGWRLGVAALLLDSLKGATPVFLAQVAGGIRGWSLLPVGLAPVLGHAFSPFLRFKGGKALATTFGVWTGLTLGEIPLILGILLAVFLFSLRQDGWALLLGLAGTQAHLLLNHGELMFITLLLLHALLLTWKYRAALRTPPNIRGLGMSGQRSEDKHA